MEFVPTELQDELYFSYLRWMLNERLRKPNIWIKDREAINQLYTIVFYPKMERDLNRFGDAMEQRKSSPFFYKEMAWPVTVLEVLIAFAVRIDDNYLGDPSDPKPYNIFLEMLYNLNGSSPKEGIKLRTYDEIEIFYQKVSRWMYREFSPDGVGSIFPLYTDRYGDQRNVEMWDQMLNYINLNFR